MKNILPSLIESFFVERLISQRQASQHTIASYRDTFQLLFKFIHIRLKKEPCSVHFEDLNVELILEFLKDLEQRRNCSVRSRNQRLSALRSFFHFLAYKVPEKSGLIQQILAIPKKRHDRAVIDFLNQNEIEALLAEPDQNTWFGRRDFLLLSFAIQTGLRLSEITGLCWNNIILGYGASVRVIGKGEKNEPFHFQKNSN